MSKENEITTIYDGQDIEVTLQNGTRETVKVRKVPLRQLQLLGSAWGREGDEIRIYTQKTDAWVDTLSEESFEEIINIGRNLNEGPFAKWVKRNSRALSVLGEDVNQKMMTAAATAAVQALAKQSSSS